MHDGTVPKTATFDHKLTAQPSPLVIALLGAGAPGLWTASSDALGKFVDATRDHGLTDGAQGGFQLPLAGPLANHDIWLRVSFAPLSVATEPHFLNGRQLWSGTSYMNGKSGKRPGPGYVQFAPFTKKVEPQVVRIGFARMPDEAGVEAVLRGLESILERALA